MAPSGSYKQVYVKCPFYRFDDGKRRVNCEGIIEDSSLSLNFRNKEDFTIQLKTFCCQHYKNCEVYRMLIDKYEEE